MPTAQSKNTKPELTVRKRLHELGFRFRLHQKIGSVRPDIILKTYNTCIFVHGCFWHRHEACHLNYLPKSNEEFWLKKFEANDIQVEWFNYDNYKPYPQLWGEFERGVSILDLLFNCGAIK